jgi:hypothetical protein
LPEAFFVYRSLLGAYFLLKNNESNKSNLYIMNVISIGPGKILGPIFYSGFLKLLN